MNKNYFFLLYSLFHILNGNSLFAEQLLGIEQTPILTDKQHTEYQQKLLDSYPYLSTIVIADKEKNEAWHHIVMRSVKSRKHYNSAEIKAYEEYGQELSVLISYILASLGKSLEQNLSTVKETKATLSELNAFSESFNDSEFAKTKRLVQEFKNYYLFGGLGSVQLMQMQQKPMFVDAWYASPTMQGHSSAVSALISQVIQALREKKPHASKLKQDFINLLPQHFNQLSAYTQERVEHYIRLFKE